MLKVSLQGEGMRGGRLRGGDEGRAAEGRG